MEGLPDEERKQCPNCGATMLKERTGETVPTDPPRQKMMWWCGCGHIEDAGLYIPPTMEQIRMEKWLIKNPDRRKRDD